MGSADGHRLLASLPADTAASVLGWLTSRGRDLPVHIPLKAVRFSRECFALIDADGSGTLDARELRAVFRALGRPASLRQVQALVEQVAGPQAAHLNFAQFAMLMHSAASGGRPQDAGSASRQAGGGRGATPRHRARQGRGGAAGGAPAAAAAAEAGELSWDDFHLLAKAFRRRAVVDGVIANEKGWREKVLALAERQAAASRASAASAAALWKHRAQRLQQRPATAAQGGAGGPADGGAGGGGAGAPAGPGAAAPRSQRGSRAGQEASELLDGAFSAGSTPRELSGIVVDGAAEGSAPLGAPGPAPSAGGAGARAGEAQAQAQAVQRQLSPMAAKLMSRLRSNALAASASIGGGARSEAQAAAALRTVSGGMVAAASRPGSSVDTHRLSSPLSRPGSAAITAASAAAAAALPGGRRTASMLRPASRRGLSEGLPTTPGPASAGGTPLPPVDAASELAEAAEPASEASEDEAEEEEDTASPGEEPCGRFDWRRSAAVMHQAAAASRAALAGPPEPGGAALSGGAATPRPGAFLGAGSRLLSGTASSRARTAPAGAAAAQRTARTSTGPRTAAAAASCAAGRRLLDRGGSLKEQLREEASKPVAREQRTHLAALLLIRGQPQQQQ